MISRPCNLVDLYFLYGRWHACDGILFILSLFVGVNVAAQGNGYNISWCSRYMRKKSRLSKFTCLFSNAWVLKYLTCQQYLIVIWMHVSFARLHLSLFVLGLNSRNKTSPLFVLFQGMKDPPWLSRLHWCFHTSYCLSLSGHLGFETTTCGFSWQHVRSDLQNLGKFHYDLCASQNLVVGMQSSGSFTLLDAMFFYYEEFAKLFIL